MSETLIRRRRKEVGISVPDLAAKVGVSETAAWKWDRGQSLPRAKLWQAIADALDLGVHELSESLLRIEPETPINRNPIDRILDNAAEKLAAHFKLPVGRVQVHLRIMPEEDGKPGGFKAGC